MYANDTSISFAASNLTDLEGNWIVTDIWPPLIWKNMFPYINYVAKF